MVAFEWPCKRTCIVGFQCSMLLLSCLLPSIQRLLFCSAWLFLLADAAQAAKLFQYPTITEYKSSVCTFICNTQPREPSHARSGNVGTAQAQPAAAEALLQDRNLRLRTLSCMCPSCSVCPGFPFTCALPSIHRLSLPRPDDLRGLFPTLLIL